MEEVAALVTAAYSVGVRRYCMIGTIPSFERRYVGRSMYLRRYIIRKPRMYDVWYGIVP